ncbi:hypothetical protein ACG02S_14850 [Roseateles sp. DC23W]|uniref:Uncharacterized protein n=1 Tax=Pelomonas dachongensis TaxID=3299029 RepID=A0ABW7EPB2_9BURK
MNHLLSQVSQTPRPEGAHRQQQQADSTHSSQLGGYRCAGRPRQLAQQQQQPRRHDGLASAAGANYPADDL